MIWEPLNCSRKRMENLNGTRESIDYKGMNCRLHKIPYAIQNFIEYKALWDDVLVERVDPRNTSHRCLYRGRGVRRKRLFNLNAVVDCKTTQIGLLC